VSSGKFAASALLSMAVAGAVVQTVHSQGAPPAAPPTGAPRQGAPGGGRGRGPSGPPPPPLPARTTTYATSAARGQYEIPDFGPNVYIFDPSVPVAEMNSLFLSMSGHSNGRDDKRTAVFFLPGVYGTPASGEQKTATNFINSTVGTVSSFQGLGAIPGEVTINGNLRVLGGLGTFWRSLQNMKFNPVDPDAPGSLRWEPSEAAPLRRLDVEGDLDLGRGHVTFGSEIENTRVSGTVYTGMARTEGTGQAHFFTTNSRVGGWNGESVNFVFAGVVGAPATNFGVPGPNGPGDKTTLETTPVSRDAPYLFVRNNKFNVFVPKARLDSRDISWGMSSREGEVQPIDRYFIAKPSDGAGRMNAALNSGKNLLLTPGLYDLDEALHITRPNTVILGTGYATLRPMKGTAAILTDDVPGVVISSLLVDSGPVKSDVLVQVGPRGSRRGVKTNPSTLVDFYVRNGGTAPGNSLTAVELNQNYAQINHSWLWRADGSKTSSSFTTNPGDVGLLVNGDNVTVLGTYVEHYRKQQVIWNGDGGRVIFFESEPVPDAPDQASLFNETPNEKGYPYFEVSPKVKTFEGVGFVMYGSQDVVRTTHIKAPTVPGVKFRSITGAWLVGGGGFENVFNLDGLAVSAGNPPTFLRGILATRQVVSWPEKK
jgi:hypothetical protein